MDHNGGRDVGWVVRRGRKRGARHLVRRGAMNELPLTQRAVLWLVNVVGFSYAETSKALGSDRFFVA